MKKNKLIAIAILFLLILVSISLYFIFKNNKKEIINEAITVKKEPISLCYIYSQKTARGLYDKASLRLDLQGTEVTGEFRNIPAEKDSKVGIFQGTVGKLNQKKMARTAYVWWIAQAEGVTNKEELILDFGDGSAVAGYGEMIDRGDGVYVYKDKNKLTYSPSLSQIQCEDLEERNIVENYVKENIKTIANNNAVLGGSWYVLSVDVNSYQDDGNVIYEDGHIQSNANFKYEYDANTKKVVIKSFLQNK